MSRHRAFHPALHSFALALTAACWVPPAWASDGAAKAAPKATSKASAKDEDESLQKLRERLAEKLGGVKTPDARKDGLVRVSTRSAGEHGDAPKPTAAKARAKPVLAKAAGAEHAAHWSYQGELGPKAWGGIKADFITCANGTRQSPIDIRSGIAVDLEPIQFDYRASAFRVIDNGHTVQVNIDAGNFIVAQGRRWELVQFHFHRPGEERIDGKSFEMSLHLVHKDADGRLAVVGLLLERGVAQPVVQTVWNNLPLEKGDEVSTRAVLDLNHLLPPDRGYYTYMGSLTTPPCTEGVLWMVMRQPVPVSPTQVEIFSRLYPMNARPIQQASGRMIKQSN
jgi:carbonic anhydrase